MDRAGVALAQRSTQAPKASASIRTRNATRKPCELNAVVRVSSSYPHVHPHAPVFADIESALLSTLVTSQSHARALIWRTACGDLTRSRRRRRKPTLSPTSLAVEAAAAPCRGRGVSRAAADRVAAAFPSRSSHVICARCALRNPRLTRAVRALLPRSAYASVASLRRRGHLRRPAGRLRPSRGSGRHLKVGNRVFVHCQEWRGVETDQLNTGGRTLGRVLT